MGLGYGEIDRIAAVVHNTSREYVREYAWVFAKKSDLNIGSTPGCYGNMISVTVTIASVEGSRRLTFCSAPISTEQTLERFMQNLFGQFRARARHSVILAQQPPNLDSYCGVFLVATYRLQSYALIVRGSTTASVTYRFKSRDCSCMRVLTRSSGYLTM
jgi:hypothetical protein